MTSLLDDVVWRVDTTTDEIVTTIPVGRGAAGIAVDESGVWVGNSLDGTVTRIDPRTNAVVETIEVGGRPVDITIGPMGIWVAAAQTPGAPAPDEGAIRIGVIRDCYGFIGFASDTSLAGVLLPLVRRGGELAGASLVDGVHGVSIGGRPIEVLFACTAAHAWGLLIEARRLVEGEEVDLIVGPTWHLEADALHDYARRQPGVSFVPAASNQPTTLREPLPNFVGANGDGAQSMAGLGVYAFNDLGWRTAAVVTEPDISFWHEGSAGFIAEFCALGEEIVHRSSASELEPDFVQSFLAEFPDSGFDGLYISQQRLFPILAEQHDLLRGNLADKVVFESNVANGAGELGSRLIGTVVSGGYTDFAWVADIERPATPEYEQYVRDLDAFVPGGTDKTLVSTGPDVSHFVAMEMALQALEAVDGDVSNGQERLQAAFAEVEVDGPYGVITLDERLRAIMPNHLLKIRESPDGGIEYARFRVIENVEQTFNGYFTPSSPAPSATEPACVSGDPPPWAASSE